LKARLASAGYDHQGAPGTWGEVLRVWKECKVRVRLSFSTPISA